ncbi:MAG TPA: HAMP domain-containing protein, partial [Tepidisphaeraceae bacterium]
MAGHGLCRFYRHRSRRPRIKSHWEDSMSLVNNLSIRSKLLLLSGVFALALVCYGLLSQLNLAQVKVTGPYYSQIIRGKDLVADILPPPEYLIEPYLLTHQLALEKDPAAASVLIERLKQLRTGTGGYEERHNYWAKELTDGPVKETLLEKSYRPAVEFFDAMNAQFIPKVLGGDQIAAQQVLLQQLAPAYERHRAAIDEVVKLVNAENASLEATTSATIDRRAWMLTLLALVLLSVGSAVAWMISRLIGRPLTQIVVAMEAISKGDLEQEITIRSRDEIGRLADGFRGLIGYIRGIALAADKLASGDLTTEVVPQGDKD